MEIIFLRYMRDFTSDSADPGILFWKKIGHMDVRTIILEEARCNPDELAGPLSRKKVPFQDQREASPAGVLLSHEWI